MLEPQQKPIQVETELTRDLGLPSALAIGVGTMIAAGIFTLSGLAVRNVGSAAIVAFLLAGCVALLTALTYCEFVSIYPESGEGYLYARRTFPPLIAYLVGWALFLGYTSSCAFYISSLSTYFNEFIWNSWFSEGSPLHVAADGSSSLHVAAGVVGLIALTLLNIKGTKESGQFQIIVTAAKVVLLCWFVAGGLGSVNPSEVVEKFNSDILLIGQTAAMVFITFFGFSAIAASAGEVKNPVKTIPRAIFLSMGIVTVLYTLVVLTIIAANLSEYSEAAMGRAAELFLGPVGGMVIVGGALFSMISASNASIMAGSRVTLSMSRLGHFPKGFAAVNPRTRTPIVSLVIVAGAILFFAVSLELEDLAHFADTVLLFGLILVNAALVVHRRRFPNMARPFRVPLVPLLPVLGILANAYLLILIAQHDPQPVFIATTALLAGLLGFVAWKGFLAPEAPLPGAPSRVALEESATMRAHPFRVLVPLANPQNVPQLIDLAAAIAAERGGEIVALRVVVVPEQLPPSREDPLVQREREVLELAQNAAKAYGVPVTSLVRIGHHAGRAIVETARQHDCDLILMGWKGYTTTAQRILGEVVDDVVRHARADIMLVKQVSHEPLRRFLLPMAGGEHTRSAEQYVSSLARAHEGSLTLCSVVSQEASELEHAQSALMLNAAAARAHEKGELQLEQKILRSGSVTEAILAESRAHDAVVIGASEVGFYKRILFGSLAESIAQRSDRPVILVKHHQPVKALLQRVINDEA